MRGFWSIFLDMVVLVNRKATLSSLEEATEWSIILQTRTLEPRRLLSDEAFRVLRVQRSGVFKDECEVQPPRQK